MNRITEVKTHLHHSHVTGWILGYVHDFCNWRLRENKTEFVCCAHNFFGFHMYFLIQGFRVTACNTKDFTVGGSGLTRINFVNISSSTKFFDEVKYYQKSLAQLIKTVTDKEKNAIKKQTKQCLVRHDYFGPIWKQIASEEKNKLLEIIASLKGIIFYEKMVSQYSLDLVPESRDFFQEIQFFSELKQRFVSDDEYENSYYLYKTLRMRNLNDINDLYNAQDVILLSDIIENYFQLMYDK